MACSLIVSLLSEETVGSIQMSDLHDPWSWSLILVNRGRLIRLRVAIYTHFIVIPSSLVSLAEVLLHSIDVSSYISSDYFQWSLFLSFGNSSRYIFLLSSFSILDVCCFGRLSIVGKIRPSRSMCPLPPFFLGQEVEQLWPIRLQHGFVWGNGYSFAYTAFDFTQPLTANDGLKISWRWGCRTSTVISKIFTYLFSLI